MASSINKILVFDTRPEIELRMERIVVMSAEMAGMDPEEYARQYLDSDVYEKWLVAKKNLPPEMLGEESI